jgi:uncharacterized protein
VAEPARLYDGFLPGRHVITGIGQGGFRFAEMSHKGSLLFMPDGVRRWSPLEPFRHDEAIYQPVLDCEAPIDLLLIGLGSIPFPMPAALKDIFRAKGIAVDVMTTTAAASTYNVLVEENRRVAAALVAID